MAATITQSIVTKFTMAGITDFSGSQGIWFGQVPANLELPFFGFVHNGEVIEYTGEKNYQASGSFTFSIYAVGVAEAERLAAIVIGFFDAFVKNWNGLDFTGGRMAEWSRRNYTVSIEPIEDVDAQKVGRVDTIYDYKVNMLLP